MVPFHIERMTYSTHTPRLRKLPQVTFQLTFFYDGALFS